MHLLLQMQTAQEPVWGQHAGEEQAGRPDPEAGPEVYGPSFTLACAKPMRAHVFRCEPKHIPAPEGAPQSARACPPGAACHHIQLPL